MRSLLRDILTSMFMGLILPGIFLNFGELLLERDTSRTGAVEQESWAQSSLMQMRLRKEDGQTVELGMDEYLVGVLLAEIPASFELEALKAQAVAARTYARKAWVTEGKHGDGSVCEDPACCQAWISEEDYLARGGTQEGLLKMENAVRDTSCEVLMYQGDLIEATYFSCSGGSTEDAVAVWGHEIPYLQAVPSPGEEKAARYMDTVFFTPQQFRQHLDMNLEGSPGSWFGETKYTEGGGVETMCIGGEAYSGTQLRKLLGLNSTDFQITVGEDIIITTYGYGHRVGLSQYGAEAMAVAGNDYIQILSHYYPGTNLISLN